MTTKIRLTATAQEIENWKAFFDLLARANVINLLEVPIATATGEKANINGFILRLN
ncbi:hypothetical protein VB834_01845 [Limnoraphis robusta Tam1]|uniref:hypothetical protein n=1 Tax=Limnoraphis robusta TaxID=1118279 RepID=UPI002B20A2D5|nr:hypothetical protein [Limnoraphis robusta]MEA5497372.1 hypothetical protein [Limnoraphis robusta BA-68 BA1]MEA5537770.1 hypothetical protein [Limnoraphis robusta Tam1]